MLEEIIKDLIKNVTETVEGYPIKGLRWKPIDNVIVGLVRDPILSNPNINNGYRSCTWYKTGKVTTKYGGKGREDLNLKMNYEDKKSISL